MTESLFTSQTPASGNLSDLGAAGGTTGTTMVFAADGEVQGIRFYATTTVSGTYTAELWDCDASDGATGGAGSGTLLASKAVASGAITPGAWNVITFDSPMPVTGSTVAYRAALHSTAGRYVATTNFFTAPLVNGNITGIQSATNPVGVGNLRNGNFRLNSAAGNYPSDFSGTSCYFVDVVYLEDTDDVSGTLAGTGPGGQGALTGTGPHVSGTLAGTGPAGASELAGTLGSPGTFAGTGPAGAAQLAGTGPHLAGALDATGPAGASDLQGGYAPGGIEGQVSGTGPGGQGALTVTSARPSGSNLLHPTDEMVAVAWVKAVTGLSVVATDLPTDNSSWAASGFVVVTSFPGQINIYTGKRRPVIALDFYAVAPNSSKPPWGKANQLAEIVIAAALDHPSVPVRIDSLPPRYAQAHVWSVWPLGSPVRIRNDPADYARYTMNVQLDWVEVPG